MPTPKSERYVSTALPNTGKTTSFTALTSSCLVLEDLEVELQAFAPEERLEFLAGLGLTETGSTRRVRKSSRPLGLATFFTGLTPKSGPGSCPTAPRLPGPPDRFMPTCKIFIQAEVMRFSDLNRQGYPPRL
jgi:hypothetical protein